MAQPFTQVLKLFPNQLNIDSIKIRKQVTELFNPLYNQYSIGKVQRQLFGKIKFKDVFGMRSFYTDLTLTL